MFYFGSGFGTLFRGAKPTHGDGIEQTVDKVE